MLGAQRSLFHADKKRQCVKKEKKKTPTSWLSVSIITSQQRVIGHGNVSNFLVTS